MECHVRQLFRLKGGANDELVHGLAIDIGHLVV